MWYANPEFLCKIQHHKLLISIGRSMSRTQEKNFKEVTKKKTLFYKDQNSYLSLNFISSNPRINQSTHHFSGKSNYMKWKQFRQGKHFSISGDADKGVALPYKKWKSRRTAKVWWIKLICLPLPLFLFQYRYKQSHTVPQGNQYLCTYGNQLERIKKDQHICLSLPLFHCHYR